MAIRLFRPALLFATLVWVSAFHGDGRSGAPAASPPLSSPTVRNPEPAPPAVPPSRRPSLRPAPPSPPSVPPEAEREAPPPPAPPAPPAPAERPAAPPPDRAANAFAGEVIRLSAEADGVDRLWQAYKVDCRVRVGRQYDFGREWFSLWDRAAEAGVEGPECSHLLWRLLRDGELLRRDLLRVRAAAQVALDPGTEIGMLRWHALQWP